jgi:E3 ubiquitin-protein ligase SHPRH
MDIQYDIVDDSVNIDALLVLLQAKAFVSHSKLNGDCTELVDHKSIIHLTSPVLLTDEQVHKVSHFMKHMDSWTLPYDVEIKPSKPSSSNNTMIVQVRQNKLFPIFTLKFANEFYNLLSLIHFFLTNKKITGLAIFVFNTFYISNLQLFLEDHELRLQFILKYDLAIKHSINSYVPSDILYKFNNLINLLCFPDPTSYQISCNQLISPPTVSSFYSLITDHTSKCYNDPSKIYLNIPGINKTLLPFQVDSIQWMLTHEGIESEIDIHGNINTKQSFYPPNPNDDDEFSKNLDSIIPGWTRIKLNNNSIWYNPYNGAICDTNYVLQYLKEINYIKSPAKGFLCEEMGLGKTLEIISLIKLNPRIDISDALTIDYLDTARQIKESKTTLILCPETIINQWYDEITSTCNELCVHVYKGIVYLEELDNHLTPTMVANELSRYDIVLTSYNLLFKELDRAIFKPTTRPKRKSSDYERIDYSSPLMLLQFFRLVLDEAQLASIGISRVAHFSRIIPRIHTWCVSGTLIRKNLQDLHSLLKSQRMYPLDKLSLNEWNQLPRFFFDRLFQNICLRHTKEMVGTQVNLPKQTRIMLRAPFSTIENDNYHDLFNRFLEQVGLNESGEPIVEGFDYERSRAGMRTWSSKLRMVCCHAMLSGSQLRRNIFLDSSSATTNVSIQISNKSGKDKNSNFIVGTLDDVLADLINNNELSSSTSFANYIRYYIKMGKIMEFLRDPNQSVSIFNNIINQLNEKIEFYKECTALSNNEKKKVWNLRIRNLLEYLHQAYFLLASAYYQHYRPMKPLPDNFNDLVENEKKKDTDLNGNDNEEKERIVVVEELSDEEREFYELETMYYSKADEILNILLDEPLKKTSEMIEKLNDLYGAFETYQIKEIPEIKTIDDANENKDVKNKNSDHSFNLPLISKYFDDFSNEFTSHSTSLGISFVLNRAKEAMLQLNEQSTIINYWFMQLYEHQKNYVIKTNEKDKTGEEYNSYLILQEQSQAYIDQLQLILDDREKAINSTEDSLSYSKKNVKGQRVFKPLSGVEISINNSLSLQLEQLRRYYVPQGTLNPRYSLHTSILELVGELQSFLPNSTEYGQLDQLVKLLKREMKKQMKNVREMRTKIFDVFNDSFNSKVSYFKSLQIRSDSLVNYFPEKLASSPKYVALMEIESLKKEIEKDKNKMRALKARLNYLKSLNTTRESTKQVNDDNLKDDACVICRFTILVGTLTPCGHKYCRDCLNEWMKTKRVCPLCQKKLNFDELYNFTYSKGGLKGDVVESIHDNKEEIIIKEHTEFGDEEDDEKVDLERLKLLQNRRLFEKDMDFVYQGLPTSEIREISNISLTKSYGTKIDMIIRQAKYLISKQPNVQILIFSQWNLFLLILGRAMNYEGVSFRSWMDQKISGSKIKGGNNISKLNQDIIDFKKDSSISCFLLNTVAQAAGLTFTNASHVFLCEPIVNLSFELQAINRIHRIGQTKETTVWNFIIEGTIEESIAYLGTKKRIQAAKVRKSIKKDDHIDEHGIEEIDDNVLEAKELTKVNDSSKIEGEVIGDEDLWAAFFAAKSAKVIDSTYK